MLWHQADFTGKNALTFSYVLPLQKIIDGIAWNSYVLFYWLVGLCNAEDHNNLVHFLL